MSRETYQRYLETSIYTYVGAYKEFILSLPDDIPSIGMLVCDQITHPSMYLQNHLLIWKMPIMGSLHPIRNSVLKTKMNYTSPPLP